jgi:hypothetical protein
LQNFPKKQCLCCGSQVAFSNLENEPGEDKDLEDEPGEDKDLEDEPGEDEDLEDEPEKDKGLEDKRLERPKT